MKVLHINSYGIFNPLFNNFYRKQKEKNIQLTVYGFAPNGAQHAALKVPDDLKKEVIYDFNCRKYLRYIFLWKHRIVYKAVKRTIPCLQKFSIVHAHSLFSNGYLSWRLKKEFGIPYVVAVRNTDVNVFFRYMFPLRWLGIRIMREAAQIIFLSAAYQEKVLMQYVPTKYREECRSKSEIIPNGIDPFWLGGTKRLKKPHNRTINIVCAGSIDSNKNQAAAIEACKKLQKQGYDVRFTMVGKIGSQKYFDSLDKAPFVKYLPPQSKENLLELYRTMDIFLMPSIHETFGLVYAEAMSQGIPVIYTCGQGFDSQFEEGTVGYHVDCFDADDIAQKVLKIFENYEEISRRCTELSTKFDWAIIANEYFQIYQNISSKTERMQSV